MKYISLTSEEILEIECLLDKILSSNSVIEMDEFLLEAHILSHELPERVKRLFYNFKLTESTIGICITNNPIRYNRIEKTPSHLPEKGKVAYATREEVLHILYGSLLGEPFAWTTMQNGYIINEIIPIKENENRVISTGSNKTLDLHTEAAFHPYAMDYLGLMCLRNPDKVPTIVSSLEGIELDPEIKRVLFEPRFLVRANIAHEVTQVQERVPILFGDINSPYIRINFNATDSLENDKEARKALDVLTKALMANVTRLILEPGDCFYLDNFRAVHGRETFTPRYDGNDRWLKRLYITGYLRKSRDLRNQSQSRIIRPLNARV